MDSDMEKLRGQCMGEMGGDAKLCMSRERCGR